MNADLDTLATALYVRIDDEMKIRSGLVPCRPVVGIEPQLSDAELVTVAVMQALLGFVSETRFLRYAGEHLGHLFRYLPRQSGYNKRLRKAAGLIATITRILGENVNSGLAPLRARALHAQVGPNQKITLTWMKTPASGPMTPG